MPTNPTLVTAVNQESTDSRRAREETKKQSKSNQRRDEPPRGQAVHSQGRVTRIIVTKSNSNSLFRKNKNKYSCLQIYTKNTNK